jgi:ketosteroid isomerase-like protein
VKKLVLLGLLIVATAIVTAQTMKPKGTAGHVGGDAATLIEVENSWPEAAMKKDIPTLERYYADDVTDVGPDGMMSTKTQDIDDIRNGVFVVESATATDLKPRIYGNAAVVTGTSDFKGKYKDQDVSGRYRFTDTFVKQDGQWRCVATQVTRIVEQQ